MVVEFTEVAEALTEGAGEGLAPSAGLETHGFLVEFNVSGGEVLHVAGFEGGEFLYGDAGFDFAGGVFLFDGEEVKAGEAFGGVLLH